MQKETREEKKKRAEKILVLLKRAYPDAKIALNFTNPWELLVATILSAQCTDKRVNIVTKRLFAKYETFEDYLKASPKEFEQDIKSTGFYRNKAANILKTAQLLKEKFDGKVPKTMAEMISLAGVARKTANVVLGNAYKIVEGIAVDTHVLRISQRLRLADMEYIRGKNKVTFTRKGRAVVDYKRDADPNKIEKELMNILDRQNWFSFNYLTIDHGRAICKAQNPNCGACPIREYCPSSRLEEYI